MAAFTSGQQILFDHQPLLRVVYSGDVMGSMAIKTYRFIAGLIWALFLEQGYGCAVKVSNVGVQNIGRKAIFCHLNRIRVAACTQLRRFQPELGGGGIGDIVYSMAICTCGNIQVACTQKQRTMGAFTVYVKDLAMTSLTGYRDFNTFFGLDFPGLGIREGRLLMSVMTVRTNGCVFIPARYRALVDAVGCLFILIIMALLADRIKLQGDISQILSSKFWMRITLNIGMASRASHVVSPVDRGTEMGCVDADTQQFPTG